MGVGGGGKVEGVGGCAGKGGMGTPAAAQKNLTSKSGQCITHTRPMTPTWKVVGYHHLSYVLGNHINSTHMFMVIIMTNNVPNDVDDVPPNNLTRASLLL